jgi:hypothetical protein
MKSYVTTLFGIASLLVAVGLAGQAMFDGDPETMPDISAVTAALAGLGLIAARDNSKTSEDVGLTKKGRLP